MIPKFFHRILLPDGSYTPGTVNHGPDGGDWPTIRFGLPNDLKGKSVIDIGCYDGFFSFEAEKRGGVVTSTDIIKRESFDWVKNALQSKAEHSLLNIQHIIDLYRKFDVVLCYGVLYHLKSPLLAMENLSFLTKNNGICLIETAISSTSMDVSLEYRPNFENDPTNYFYPTSGWIHSAAKEVGFRSSECIFVLQNGSRATYRLTK